MPVIVKERPPALALTMVRLSLWEISRDCGEADRDPKFFEFSPNLSGAPAVFICESTNEGLYLIRNGRSPRTTLRNRSPVQPKSFAMPADHGFSTIACLLRLRNRAGIQRREIVASLSSCHIASRILHRPDVDYETESWSSFGLSSNVDPSSVEGESSMIPVRSSFENRQPSGVINMNSAVERHERMDGVLNYYDRRAA